MKQGQSDESEITAKLKGEAFQWWLLLDEGAATPADQRKFAEWVNRSPERIEAYLETVWLAKGLQSKKTSWPETAIDELIREAKSSSAELIELIQTPSEDMSDAGPRAYWLPIAASMLIAFAAGYLLLKPEHYETKLGEQRSVALHDGSRITLNTSSAIEVRMTSSERSIKLLSGEALFQVAHDARRPFEVAVGDTTVRAIGTAFNIDKRASTTTITVVDGRVAVSSDFSRSIPLQHMEKDGAETRQGKAIELSAGEQATMGRKAPPRRIKANIATATAWTQHKLVFKDQRLTEVAQEFNRYNARKIEIQGSELSDQEVTGVFDADNPEALIAFISRIPNISVQRSEGGRRYRVTQTH